MKLRICRCFRFEFSILAGPSIFLEISYYEHMDIPLEKVSVSSLQMATLLSYFMVQGDSVEESRLRICYRTSQNC